VKDQSHEQSRMQGSHYGRLGLMFGLHFIAMYILMYAMVHDLAANVYNSWNNAYMAALMTSSMGAIELGLMGKMYPNKKWNIAIVVLSVLVLVGSWMFIRKQTAIGDTQFIRSMIPHHSGAILMCREANIEDTELKALCGEIIEGQQREIDQMKNILGRLKRQ
jgi:uncharacterized protein (DUF305 family)